MLDKTSVTPSLHFPPPINSEEVCLGIGFFSRP
jgi:hypothetical protein